ncbi:MAG: hypothetical protein MZU97_05905 [Bacillus subtilis]|nr:hypothetical protein [Bacillus subtilis]
MTTRFAANATRSIFSAWLSRRLRRRSARSSPSLVLEAIPGRINLSLTAFYLVIGIGFGIFFASPLVLIGLFTKERVKMPERRNPSSRSRRFIKPLTVKAFRGLVVHVSRPGDRDGHPRRRASSITRSYVARGSSTVFLGIFIGVQLLMFPMINILVNKVDKKKIYYFGLPFAIVSVRRRRPVSRRVADRRRLRVDRVDRDRLRRRAADELDHLPRRRSTSPN